MEGREKGKKRHHFPISIQESSVNQQLHQIAL